MGTLSARPVCIVHFLMILYCKQSITKSAEFRGHKSDDMKSSVSAHWASANNNLTDVMSLQVFKRLTPMVGIYKVHHAEIIPEQAALKNCKKNISTDGEVMLKIKVAFFRETVRSCSGSILCLFVNILHQSNLNKTLKTDTFGRLAVYVHAWRPHIKYIQTCHLLAACSSLEAPFI